MEGKLGTQRARFEIKLLNCSITGKIITTKVWFFLKKIDLFPKPGQSCKFAVKNVQGGTVSFKFLFVVQK